MSLFQIIGYPLFAVAVLEMLLAAFLVKQNPRNSPVNKSVAAFSFFCACFSLNTAVMYVRASLGLDFVLNARMNWIGWFGIPAALQFIYYMRDEKSRAARNAGWVLYPFWLAVFCVSVLTDLVVPDDYTLIPHTNRPAPLETPLRIAAGGLIIWVMAEMIKLRREVTGLKRMQLNYFSHGILIFGAGGAFLAGFLQAVGGLGFEPGLASYFSLPWVLFTYNAITRHRLFDIRIVISRTITIAILSAFFSVIHIGLFKLMAPALGETLAILISLTFIGFLFFGTTFSRAVQQWTRRVIVKDKYDYQRILKESINAIITILDRDELLRYIIESMRKSLGISTIYLFLRERDGRYTIRHGAGILMESAERRSLAQMAVQWLQQEGRTVVREELEATLPEEGFGGLAAYMRGIGAEIMIPMVYKGELQGVLALGEKGTRESYVQSDIDLLEALAGHAAVAMENASLYEEAGRIRGSLQESEEKFRTLADTTAAGIFIHTGGKFLYANRAGLKMTGYSQEELLSMDFWGLTHPDYKQLVMERAQARLHGEQPPQQYEFKIIRKDGEERAVLMTAGLIEYEGRPSVIGTLFDITERKQLESQLRYAQKMEAIGRLAGGVAHDFNNIVTAIVGYANVLRMKLAKDDPLAGYVDKILDSTERAANVTQNLLAFGKKQDLNLKAVNMNGLVGGMEKLITGLLGTASGLRTYLGDKEATVMADSGQLERVIMNLVVNAKDAMPKGGALTLETGVMELGNDFIRTHGYGRPGAYAYLSVADTGVGMDEHTVKKVFEPFFTTKGFAKGTGFGLSIAYEIIKSHQGYITVQSSPGNGSTFTLYLPVTTTAREEKPAPLAPPQAGHDMVLVAENEDDVRGYIASVLERSGYRVIAAEDGEDAVKKFMANRNEIQLMVLDLIMPRMNGREAYGAIREIAPDVKVLFTSGYDAGTLHAKGIFEPGMHFVLKPFSPDVLLKKVRDVLAEKVEKA
jgi:PAS domain S-box-containing protein